LTDVKVIAARHDAVAFFAGDSELRRHVREDLRRAPDIARALARLSVGRGGPRDLAALRDGISSARALRDVLKFDDLKPSPGEVREAHHTLTLGIAALSQLVGRLEHLLV